MTTLTVAETFTGEVLQISTINSLGINALKRKIAELKTHFPGEAIFEILELSNSDERLNKWFEDYLNTKINMSIIEEDDE